MLKPHLDMSRELRKKIKNYFKKDILKLINNAVLRECEKTQRHKTWKTKKSRNYLVSESNYFTTKFFSENLLDTGMKKKQIFINKLSTIYIRIKQNSNVWGLVWLCQTEIWRKSKTMLLCYMNKDSSIVYIKTDDICKDITEDAGKRFDTSNYELGRPLPKGKNKSVIVLMKDELCRKIMKEFAALRAKHTAI